MLLKGLMIVIILFFLFLIIIAFSVSIAGKRNVKSFAKPQHSELKLMFAKLLGKINPFTHNGLFFAIRDISAINNLFSLASSNPDKSPSLTYEQTIKAKGVIKIAGNLTPECIIKKYASKKRLLCWSFPINSICCCKDVVKISGSYDRDVRQCLYK